MTAAADAPDTPEPSDVVDAARFTAFDGHRRLGAGDLETAVLAAKRAIDSGAAGPVHVYAESTGKVVDVDVRGSDDEVLERVRASSAPRPGPDEPRGRGRPRLGVVAREVTLLPRHWEWLAAQPGGASVALRKLVDEARRANGESDRVRERREAAYRFMSAMAGDLPGFEEATRALFAGDAPRFAEETAGWPADVREHAHMLAGPGLAHTDAGR